MTSTHHNPHSNPVRSASRGAVSRLRSGIGPWNGPPSVPRFTMRPRRRPGLRFALRIVPCLVLTVGLTVGLTGCTSNPIGPVSDFDFVFDEIRDVHLGEAPDTSTIVVEYEPVEEDTTYLEKQNQFIADAGSAPQSGSVPPSVVSVSEAVFAAFDDASGDRLGVLAEEASLDADAFVEQHYQALKDSTSDVWLFAEQIADLAATEAALDELLGGSTSNLTARPTIRSTLASSRPAPSSEAALAANRAAPSPTTPFTPFSMSGTSSCETDARIQTQDQLESLDRERRRREAALERALRNSLEAVEAFRSREMERVATNVERRKRGAATYYRDAGGAIVSLVENGLINQGTAANLRMAMVTVVISRLKRTIEFERRSGSSIAQTAEEAVAAARTRYEQQLAQLEASYDDAVTTLGRVESTAVADCHDQGTSSG
ncbi:MAG: hypothetical protein WD021_10365 [Rhodothermales bacterium]